MIVYLATVQRPGLLLIERWKRGDLDVYPAVVQRSGTLVLERLNHCGLDV